MPPISLANAFAYESSEQLEKVFQNRAPGFAYTRIANPTVDAFERRVNELEGGIGGVACSSGMSAVTLSLLNILQAGDEVRLERNPGGLHDKKFSGREAFLL